jgi:hypothetical protein
MLASSGAAVRPASHRRVVGIASNFVDAHPKLWPGGRICDHPPRTASEHGLRSVDQSHGHSQADAAASVRSHGQLDCALVLTSPLTPAG